MSLILRGLVLVTNSFLYIFFKFVTDKFIYYFLQNYIQEYESIQKPKEKNYEMINMNFEKEFEWAKFKVMEDTFDALAHVAGHAPHGTYDGRSTLKAFNKFRTMKQDYGNIKSFAQHLCNISRYFKIPENSKIINEAGKNLNCFANNYEMFLIY